MGEFGWCHIGREIGSIKDESNLSFSIVVDMMKIHSVLKLECDPDMGGSFLVYKNPVIMSLDI